MLEQLKAYIYGAIFMAFLGVAGFGWIQHKEVLTLRTDKVTLQDSLAQKAKDLQQMSDSLRKFQELQDQTSNQAKKDVEAAQASAQKNYSNSTKILIEKPTGNNDCANIHQLLNEYIAQRHSESGNSTGVTR